MNCASSLSQHAKWCDASAAQALADTPPERAAWLLIIDQDAVVDDMSFNLPLRRYGDADLILLGDQALVAGDQYRSRASLKLGEPLQGALAGCRGTSCVKVVSGGWIEPLIEPLPSPLLLATLWPLAVAVGRHETIGLAAAHPPLQLVHSISGVRLQG